MFADLKKETDQQAYLLSATVALACKKIDDFVKEIKGARI